MIMVKYTGFETAKSGIGLGALTTSAVPTEPVKSPDELETRLNTLLRHQH